MHPLPQVDSEVADAVALDCSYAQCDPESSCYHTHCLEKFLKSMKCERCVGHSTAAAERRLERAVVAALHLGVGACRTVLSGWLSCCFLQEPQDWLPLPARLRQGHQVQGGVPWQGAQLDLQVLVQMLALPAGALLRVVHWHVLSQRCSGCSFLLGAALQILKSHPVTIRSEANKKRRQVSGGPFLAKASIAVVVPADSVLHVEGDGNVILLPWCRLS